MSRASSSVLVVWLLACGGCASAPTPGERPAARQAALTRAQAPGWVELGAQPRVGMGVVFRAGVLRSQRPTAALRIVGETPHAWRIELTPPPDEAPLPGAVLGLTVRKQDGRVLTAVAGLPGERGDPIALGAEAPPREAWTPLAYARLHLAIGTVRSLKTTSRGRSRWFSDHPRTRGLLLGWAGPNTAWELAALRREPVTLPGGARLEAVRLDYTNGLRVTLTQHPVVRALLPNAWGSDGSWGFVDTDYAGGARTDGVTLVDVEEHAQPQLAWPPVEAPLEARAAGAAPAPVM